MPTKRRKRQEWSSSMSSNRAEAYGVALPVQSTSERFLSPNDIGKILSVTGEAVKQWIYHRRLPAVKLANGYWKVKVSDFEAFLKARMDVGRRRVMVFSSADSGIEDVVEVLRQLGHTPITSNHLLDSVLKFNDSTPALVIIVCSMNNNECWAFAQRIRSQNSTQGKVPILLIADHDLTEADAALAVELSAKAFLRLPLAASALERELQRILNP